MITRSELMDWLKSVDDKLSTNMVVVAVGGTAMTLLGLKSSTRDVDFCVESKHFKTFRDLTKNGRFKVDLFKDGFIFAEQLPADYHEQADKVQTDLKRVDLKTLSLPDIIITKSARYNERDEEDISTIASTGKVNKIYLERRFWKVRDTFVGNTKDYDYHFNLVLSRHFK